jgi:hypothetical protein
VFAQLNGNQTDTVRYTLEKVMVPNLPTYTNNLTVRAESSAHNGVWHLMWQIENTDETGAETSRMLNSDCPNLTVRLTQAVFTTVTTN